MEFVGKYDSATPGEQKSETILFHTPTHCGLPIKNEILHNLHEFVELSSCWPPACVDGGSELPVIATLWSIPLWMPEVALGKMMSHSLFLYLSPWM